MKEIPCTSQYRNCPASRTGHACLPGPGKRHTCPLTRNRARSAPLHHGGPSGIAPQKLHRALLNALGPDARLVQMDLPSGCSAAWFGGIGTDWIGYAGDTPTAVGALAHAAGHLSLLHCGRVRDGGRFACVDTHHHGDISYRIHMLLGEDSGFPSPLFTPEEEAAASSFAAAMLVQCGYREEVPAPLNPIGHQTFQCIG